MFSQDQTETEKLLATVTSYAESDCTNDNYGENLSGVGYRTGNEFISVPKQIK